MINWADFEHTHVIKKLREILGSWWSVDILFTDENGVIKGRDIFKDTNHGSQEGERGLINPGSRVHLLKEEARASLAEIILRSFQKLKNTKKLYNLERWETAGYDVAVAPIEIAGNFMGAVVAIGFCEGLRDEKRFHEIAEKFHNAGLLPKLVEQCVKKINFIEDHHRDHFLELLSLVSQEVVILHSEISDRENRIQELNKELGSKYKYDNMIGKSKPMQRLYHLLDKIKMAESTVLIQGENGTGKELIAKAIHYNSFRKERIFMAQNCSSFNDNLLESELFGHTKGSFTGAVRNKKGLFEVTHRGTFFLDEIGDTSPAMQVKLLRVLQEGTFIPIGALEPKKVDVRIIAATNRNLKEMVEKGTFREDLYYRLNVINIQVPPLRERKEDISLLVEYFISNAKKDSQQKKSLTARCLGKLLDYNWPGNVRELQNEIERLLVLAGDEEKIDSQSLSPKILMAGSRQHSPVPGEGALRSGTLKEALEELERKIIEEGLHRTGWNKSRLAKELGVSRAGLIMKVDKYGLDKRKYRSS